MAGQDVQNRSTASLDEFEIVEGDPDHLKNIVTLPRRSSPRIDPTTLKLRHRLGRGQFGDLWLATHHQKNEDYEEYHEVAVKMLHPIKEDYIKTVCDKLDDLFFKCQGLESVCWLHGFSIISGKVTNILSFDTILQLNCPSHVLHMFFQICIVMKFYEGSVGDKMTRLKGGKLSLRDVLR